MPRVTDIAVYRQPAHDTIEIRTRTSVQNLGTLVSEVYEKLFSYITERKAVPTDVPFITYYNTDMSDLDVSIGIPVSAELPAHGEIRPKKILETDVVSCIFRGSYSDTAETYNEMHEWMSRSYYKPTGTVNEYYFNSPASVPEEELLTRIVFPIKTWTL